jgi:hypothetical protein
MPIFVQWKWKERTNTFLLIFHFFDDFSKSNLRIKKCEKGRLLMLTPSEIVSPLKAWMTWSPSHLEMALLTQLLTYANIINGLKGDEKDQLKVDLEGQRHLLRCGFKKTPLDYFVNVEPRPLLRGISTMPDKKLVIYSADSGELSSFAELCPEYIDYLQKMLKSYL